MDAGNLNLTANGLVMRSTSKGPIKRGNYHRVSLEWDIEQSHFLTWFVFSCTDVALVGNRAVSVFLWAPILSNYDG